MTIHDVSSENSAESSMENEQETSEIMQPSVPNPVSDDDDEEIDDGSLPFPKATIVNMMRQYLEPGKQIKGQVKVEMNKWLGRMVERITKKMNKHPYTYIDQSMLKEAIETYENIQDIEDERDRIISYLEKIKSDCDLLIREVDRKFEL